MECAPWGAKELPTTWYVGLTARCSVFFLLNQSIDNHIYIYIISIYIYIYTYYIYIHVHRWFTLIHTNRTSMQYTKSPCYRIKYYVSFFCFTKCRCTIHVWSGRSMNSISHSKPLASVFSTDIYLFVCLSINVSLSTSIYFYLLLSTSIYFYLLLSTSIYFIHIYLYLSVSIYLAI